MVQMLGKKDGKKTMGYRVMSLFFLKLYDFMMFVIMKSFGPLLNYIYGVFFGAFESK